MAMIFVYYDLFKTYTYQERVSKIEETKNFNGNLKLSPLLKHIWLKPLKCNNRFLDRGKKDATQ